MRITKEQGVVLIDKQLQQFGTDCSEEGWLGRYRVLPEEKQAWLDWCEEYLGAGFEEDMKEFDEEYGLLVVAAGIR